jgi:acyl carrier protein
MTLENTAAEASRQKISGWLIDWISKELEMPAEDIDTGHSLLQYSMSSVTATILVGDLEDSLDLRLSPTLVWDYPTIDAMTDYLVQESQRQAGSTTVAPATSSTEGARELLDNLDELSEEEIDALLKQLSADEDS